MEDENYTQKILAFLPPRKMKAPYKILICLLFAGALVLAILSYFSWLGCDAQAARLIQIGTALAIAITAIIALSNADLPKQKIKAQVERYITNKIENWKITYPKEEIAGELSKFFSNCSQPIISYKVQFKIINVSKFDWVKPVVTFWLPVEKQHPQKK